MSARLRAIASPWLVGLPISIALHLVAVVTAMAFLRAEPVPRGLVVDLSETVAKTEDPVPSSSGSPSIAPGAPRGGARSDAPPAPPARRPRAPAAESEPRPAPREAVTPPPAPPPPEVPARPTEPSPVVAAVDPAPGANAVSPTPSAAPTPRGPQPASGGSGRDAGAAGVGSGVGSAAGVPGGSDAGGAPGTRGGGTGDRIAALTPGGDGGPGGDYGPYQSRLRQRIQELLRYPPAARRRGISGTVQLEIGVQSDGSIGAVSVVASSSHEVLDQAAVNAVRALPRIPFPSDLRPASFTVRLPVVFELRER